MRNSLFKFHIQNSIGYWEGADFTLRIKKDSNQESTWLVPKRLLVPGNFSVSKYLNDDLSIGFKDYEGIIRVNNIVPNVKELGHDETVKVITKQINGHNKPIAAFIDKKGHELWDAGEHEALNFYTLFGETYKIKIEDVLEQAKLFNVTNDLFNDRLIKQNVITCLDTASVINDISIYISGYPERLTVTRNELLTFKFKDGFIETVTLGELLNGYVLKGHNLLDSISPKNKKHCDVEFDDISYDDFEVLTENQYVNMRIKLTPELINELAWFSTFSSRHVTTNIHFCVYTIDDDRRKVYKLQAPKNIETLLGNSNTHIVELETLIDKDKFSTPEQFKDLVAEVNKIIIDSVKDDVFNIITYKGVPIFNGYKRNRITHIFENAFAEILNELDPDYSDKLKAIDHICPF